MGRPRLHNAETEARLVGAAEALIERDGLAALSLRRLAEDAGTTTRAVYSLFGGKEGLTVALTRRAFKLLASLLEELPTTADPAADLVEAGVQVFRRFACEHPSLFRLAIQQTLAPAALTRQARPTANAAFEQLKARVARLDEAGSLGGRTVPTAAAEFHALCEGLAALELRGWLADHHPEQTWREALTALVAGFAHPVSTRPSLEKRRTAGP